ncbi:MAG: Gfo/Idh/MocA family oxidoreductase [Planctomycetota bacterium]
MVIVNIGFIGMGFMGQVVHLDNYVRVPECEVRAICDVRPRLLDAVAAKYKIEKVYLDYKEMLADEELDAIVCCQPPSNTYPIARDVLLAGKHLLTQSPMATCLDDARELVALAEERNLVYGVGNMKRYDMGVEKARIELLKIFESGDMGPLLRVDAHCFGGDWINEIRPPIDFPDEPPPHPTPPHYPDFLDSDKREAYLEYLRIYSHNINLLRYFMPAGDLEVMESLISYRRGILSHNTSFTIGKVPVSLRGTATMAHEWQEETSFLFEKGRVTIQTPSPLRMQAAAAVEIYKSDGHAGTLRILHTPRLWAFMLQAAGFSGALAGIGEFRAPGGECLADIAHVEEVFRKAKFIGGKEGN